jgi:hypothetical protein
VLGAVLFDRVQFGAGVRKRTLDQHFDLGIIGLTNQLTYMDGVVDRRVVEIRNVGIRWRDEMRRTTIRRYAFVSVPEFFVRLDLNFGGS